MTGKVVKDSIRHRGEQLRFRVVDRDGHGPSIPVTYTGTVPDPFRGGREIVLTGEVENGTFVGEPDTLVTKCPSKFTTECELASAAPPWRCPSSPSSSPWSRRCSAATPTSAG